MAPLELNNLLLQRRELTPRFTSRRSLFRRTLWLIILVDLLGVLRANGGVIRRTAADPNHAVCAAESSHELFVQLLSFFLPLSPLCLVSLFQPVSAIGGRAGELE